MLAALTSAVVLGCSVGPASNRVADTPPSLGGPAPTETPGHEGTEPPAEPTGAPSSPAVPLPDPADEEGSASVGDSLIEGTSSLSDVCCTVALPDGSFLVAHTNSWAIDLVSPAGVVTSAGAVQDSSLAGDGLGILGMAVHPNATMDDLDVYVYLANVPNSWVASYSYDAGAPEGQQLIASGNVLIRDIPRANAHNGGALAFGPDGNLYVGTGDTGQPGLAQDPASLAGKILRLEPDGAIPSGNLDPNSYVYASGFTDVEGLTWDSLERLWVADSGDGTGTAPAEVNRIAPGGDYTVEEPVLSWSPDDPDAPQPTGLAYDDGSRSLWMTSGTDEGVWRVPLDGEGGVVGGEGGPALLTADGLGVGQDVVPGRGDGSLYVLDQTSGQILELTVT
ncbi:PQQ-dependent sugar dehydrogenase [Streptomyces sp. 4N509B]|uniref:PQQ-dependent sugar dehydrogenase n=1 Tax=Streptomyces sp. 4N509B TaxID=3457413 RepID=UPI003FD213F7